MMRPENRLVAHIHNYMDGDGDGSAGRAMDLYLSISISIYIHRYIGPWVEPST